MNWTIRPNMTSGKIEQQMKTDDREQLRESEQRRDHLEKLAVMHAGQEVYVQISGDGAYADIADRDSEMGYTDRVIINVRANIPDQCRTSLDVDVWDMMVQKTDLYHELGHVLYTDWPSFEKVLLNVVEDDHKQAFNTWSNLIEDAAIERMLVDRFNIESDLRVTNENLLHANKPDAMVSLAQAVSMALIEYKHPTGWIDKLLNPGNDDFQFLTDEERETFEDEIHPEIEARVPDIIDEPDPEKRNEMIGEFYEAIKDYFDDSITPGLDEDNSFNTPKDHEDLGDGSTGMNFDSPDDPDGTPDVDLPDPGDMKMPDVDKQQDYKNQAEDQKEQMDPDADIENIEKWGRVIDKEYEDGTSMTLDVVGDPPENGSYDDATRQDAERLSQPLARELRQRLRHEQRTQKQRKKKSGKVDSKRVHKTQQGSTNVFQKTSDPDDKDYACMIVLDRSGSMRSQVSDAEKAAGGLAFALEDIGVEVGQLSFSGGDIMLEKDFGEDVEDAKKKIFRGYNSGGTPMSDALALARARLSIAGDHSFVIVITDGEPDHRERYRDELHKCDFPVLGVYLNNNGEFGDDHINENAYFHALELRKYTDAIDGVRNLVKSVMF